MSAGQASWAGWRAPEGKTCGSCRWLFEKEGRRSLLSEPLGRCSKFCALTGKKGPKFSAHCVACRFFGDGSPRPQRRSSLLLAWFAPARTSGCSTDSIFAAALDYLNCKTGRCDPGAKTLAVDVAVSERTVRRGLERLQAKRLVCVFSGFRNAEAERQCSVSPYPQVRTAICPPRPRTAMCPHPPRRPIRGADKWPMRCGQMEQ